MENTMARKTLVGKLRLFLPTLALSRSGIRVTDFSVLSRESPAPLIFYCLQLGSVFTILCFRTLVNCFLKLRKKISGRRAAFAAAGPPGFFARWLCAGFCVMIVDRRKAAAVLGRQHIRGAPGVLKAWAFAPKKADAKNNYFAIISET